jgi:hypothetical protein
MSVQMPQTNRSANGVAVNGIFIYGNRLFLMDKYRGAQFREYRIKG